MKLSANVDVTLAGAEGYNVQVLMGKRDNPEMELCARRIMSLIKEAGYDKPLLLSLQLTSLDLPTIRSVIDKVTELVQDKR